MNEILRLTQEVERLKNLIIGRETGNKSQKGGKMTLVEPGTERTDATNVGQLEDSDDDKKFEAFFHGH